MTPKTYSAWLGWAVSELGRAGVDGPRLDAKLLLLKAAGIDSAELIMKSDAILPADIAGDFQAVISRRMAGEPVSLILGEVEFMGLTFRTDARALAPRQDSERLVELALERSEGQGEGRVVDLGTGSGCLILSFLHYREGWRGTALDKSVEALSLAKENAEALSLSSRLDFIQGSWPAAENALRKADLVISNPPYIPTTDIEGLAPEVRNYDPALALDGGADGFVAYRAIIALLEETIRPGVRVLMEIGFDQAEGLGLLFKRHGFADFEVHKDFSGHNRVVEAVFS